MIKFEHKYNIGDRIFHNTPESDVGLIIDILYYVATDEVRYLIAIGFNNEVVALERELSNEKIII